MDRPGRDYQGKLGGGDKFFLLALFGAAPRCSRTCKRVRGPIRAAFARQYKRADGGLAANENGGPEAAVRKLSVLSYCAMRRLDRAVPIELKAVTSWLAVLISVNLSAELAQFFMTAWVGSPPVLTCTV